MLVCNFRGITEVLRKGVWSWDRFIRLGEDDPKCQRCIDGDNLKSETLTLLLSTALKVRSRSVLPSNWLGIPSHMMYSAMSTVCKSCQTPYQTEREAPHTFRGWIADRTDVLQDADGVTGRHGKCRRPQWQQSHSLVLPVIFHRERQLKNIRCSQEEHSNSRSTHRSQ